MQLFVPDGSGRYEAQVLDRPLAIDDGGTLVPIRRGAALDRSREIARLVPWRGQDGQRGAVLLARSRGVIVDGRSALPLNSLRRGSEIRAAGMSFFFTDETPLRIVAFTPETGVPEAICTRCQGSIQPGEPVICCPLCGVVYMAQPDKSPNCWEFGPCLVCGRDPHVEFVWHPGDSASVVPCSERP
jgi:hypothetical protein